jgi:hypothetical protein
MKKILILAEVPDKFITKEQFFKLKTAAAVLGIKILQAGEPGSEPYTIKMI